MQDASRIIKCVLGALSYVHNVHNISHRDLKPENFIFETVFFCSVCMLLTNWVCAACWGLKVEDHWLRFVAIWWRGATHDHKSWNSLLHCSWGSHAVSVRQLSYYDVTKLFCRRYDKECDLWSVGVITFVLLCGYPPFYGMHYMVLMLQPECNNSINRWHWRWNLRFR